MKLGSILGALAPGLSATGLFGNAAQGVGGGVLSALSPILAMLLKDKKKHKKPMDEGSALTEAGKAAANRPAISSPVGQALVNPQYGPGTMPPMPAIFQGGMPQMGGLSTGMQMPQPPKGLYGR